MLRPDGSVCFIDFETASTDPKARQFQGAPGFVVPSHCEGPAVDRYMLGCLGRDTFRHAVRAARLAANRPRLACAEAAYAAGLLGGAAEWLVREKFVRRS